MRRRGVRGQQLFNVLPDCIFLHQLVPVLVFQSRCLVANVSLAIDQHLLRDNESRRAEAHEGDHLILRNPADRKIHAKILGEVIHQQIGIRIDCNVDHLQAARAVFRLEFRHHFRGGLTMRAGREDELERNDFAAILT